MRGYGVAKFKVGQRVVVLQWKRNRIARVLKVGARADVDSPWYLVGEALHGIFWVRERGLEAPAVEQVIERWRRGDI